MKSIVICGSRRFKSEIRVFSKKLRSLGVVIFEPYLHSGHEEKFLNNKQDLNFIL